MKLSLDKKFGWIHCKGGRLLRVAQEHAVPTRGRSVHADELGRTIDGPSQEHAHQAAKQRQKEGWVWAKPGDLALEILQAKTGKVLGHSYLSGPAIQLNRYTPCQRGWFDDTSAALLRGASLPVPEQHKEEGAFIRALISSLMDVKYSCDVAVFDITMKGIPKGRAEEVGENALQAIKRAYGYEPIDDDGNAIPQTETAHLIGTIKCKPFTLMMHWQPKEAASDLCATPFQAALAIDAAERALRRS